MLIFCIYFLFSAIIPLQSATAGTPDDFWGEYKAAKESKRVKNLTEHVQSLSMPLNTDSDLQLKNKKTAILWFMATGGKNGFRKRHATSEEKGILKNALVFAAVVHKLENGDEPLLIELIRINAGLGSGSARVKQHLAKAQGIITATAIMLNSSLGSELFRIYIQELFNKEYIGSVLRAKYDESISMTQWKQEARVFSNIFTLDFDLYLKTTLYEKMNSRFRGSDIPIGFREPSTETSAMAFRELVFRNCTPIPELYYPKAESVPVIKKPSVAEKVIHRAMRIVTDNGLVIERAADGAVKLLPQRDIRIGFMSLGAGSVMMAGTGISMGPINLNKDQSEREFLDAINVFAGIVEKTYI